MVETSNSGVRIENYGRKNWRTLVRDEASGWAITGPAYPTKGEALVNVERVASEYYGKV